MHSEEARKIVLDHDVPSLCVKNLYSRDTNVSRLEDLAQAARARIAVFLPRRYRLAGVGDPFRFVSGVLAQRDWLMLLLGVGDARPLDPIRIQKGMFLLAQEGGLREDEQYAFRPYDYGPFSSRIYSDLDELVDEQLVAREPVEGYTWSRFRLTPEGLAEAQSVADRLTEHQRMSARFLAGLKRDVLSLSFNELLRYVYNRYPDYAKNSVFSG